MGLRTSLFSPHVINFESGFLAFRVFFRQVKVPALALLARDDPLCPPSAWEGALERAAKSEGIIVAITDKGGHCGWFDGLGAGSWVDRVSEAEPFGAQGRRGRGALEGWEGGL